MIAPDGHIHRWTAPRKNHATCTENQRLHQKPGRATMKIYALSELGYIGSISTPDKATLKAEAHALQCATAGPYNAVPTSLHGVGSVCGLGPDLVGMHTVSFAAATELPRVRIRSAKASRRSRQLESMTVLQSLRSAHRGKGISCSFHGSVYCGSVQCGMLANLMNLHRTRNRRLPQPCSATNYIGRILLGRSLCGPPRFLD